MTNPNRPQGGELDMTPDAHNEDLFCLSCGYNLRGLSGDPIRCPECFRHNRLRDLRVPPKEVTRMAKKMLHRANLSNYGLYAMAAAIPVVFLCSVPVGLLLAFAAVVLWTLGTYGFGRFCSFRRGWKGLLLQFQLVAIRTILVVALIVYWLAMSEINPRVAHVSTVLLCVVGLIGVFWNPLFRSAQRSGRHEDMYIVARKDLKQFCIAFFEDRVRAQAARGC